MPHKLFSIESRKGGVGKTTVALNLASVLVKKGPVLLLDCDITGTSIVDPAKNSSFWNTITNVLTYVDKEGKTNDINLIRFFLERFIKGEGNVQDIITQKKVNSKKVNILGSSLYGTSKEASINSSWLLEELHSYWMVEFVRQIITAFENLFPELTVSIIIDNSPGFTTFSQALHNYMFDEGPAKAKYLLVSTLDSQDLIANIEAAAEIDNCVKNRIEAAKYFASKEKNEQEDNSYTNAETLIETNGEIKEFFFQLIDNNLLLETYTKEYDTNSYLALILNKIPQSIQDDDSIVAYEDIVGERLHFLSQIAGSNGESDPKNLVFYDESIVYQYYYNYLRKKPGPRPSYDGYWIRRMRELRQQADEASQLAPLAGMTKLNSCYLALQTSLLQHGHAQIARQFKDSWAPNYAIERFKMALSKTTSKLSVPLTIPSQEVKEMLHLWNRELLQALRVDLDVLDAELTVLSDMMDYFESLTGLKDETRQPEKMVVVSLLLWSLYSSLKLTEEYKSGASISISTYLYRVGGKINKRVIENAKEGIIVNPELTLRGVWLNKLIDENITLLFSLFLYTIFRLLEQFEDFSYILAAVNLYLPTVPSLSFSKEMTDHISDVVVRKKKKHDTNQLAEIKAKSSIMKNMQDVLRDNVLKAWE